MFLEIGNDLRHVHHTIGIVICEMTYVIAERVVGDTGYLRMRIFQGKFCMHPCGF